MDTTTLSCPGCGERASHEHVGMYDAPAATDTRRDEYRCIDCRLIFAVQSSYLS